MPNDHHVNPERAAFELFKNLPRDEPIWMLNLVRFRDRALYPAEHPDAALGLSGAEAYAEYGRTSLATAARVGARIVWRGSMQVMLTGPADERWDTIFIAHYPTAGAFLAMVTDPHYRLAVVHRTAAVETSRLIRMQSLSLEGGFA
jgi:uncharacterized protein (DUF1330 family)